MQVTTEQRTPCEVELKIEVGAETVAQTVEAVYREFSKTTNIPGFRKGKTPRTILERYITPESVQRRAVEMMVPPAYQKALEEQDIHPYAEPDIDVVQFDREQPFIFKASIPLPPKVELGDYKGIEVERTVREITDEDMQEQLTSLQESRSTTAPVEDRGVQNGDIVVASIASAVDGGEKSESRKSLVEVGSNVPGFDENILGMEPGQNRTFTIDYPADYPDENLAGKKAEFDVTVESIKERVIPELNDEFAKSIGSFETLDEMREDIKSRMVKAAEESADKEVESKLVEELINRSEICFPDVLVEHELYHDLESFERNLSRQGVTFDRYLQYTGKTQEEVVAEMREAASHRIRVGLALGEIADVENIDVTEEDIDAEIDRIAEESSAPVESVQSYIETRGGRSTLKNSMINRKIMDHLKAVSKIK